MRRAIADNSNDRLVIAGVARPHTTLQISALSRFVRHSFTRLRSV
jgi:hypothetical protein